MRIHLESFAIAGRRTGSGRYPNRSEAGVTLIECLVYIGLLFVIMELAYSAYDKTQVTSQQLRKNTDDIVASLHAGERWREDVRKATNEPAMEKGMMRLQQRTGEVIYDFREGSIYRRSTSIPQWTRLLPSVKDSRMIKDVGMNVTSWRWELELKAKQNTPRVHPLFTFQAVSGGNAK